MLVLQHIWELFEDDPHKEAIRFGSLMLLAATFAGGIIAASFAIVDINSNVQFNRQMGLCTLQERGRIATLWAPGVRHLSHKCRSLDAG